MNKAKHFCAGIYLRRLLGGRYEILGATSNRFPGDVKLPGGTNENAPWEEPDKTFVREFSEETGITPVNFRQIHLENIDGHERFFYICLGVSAQPEFNIRTYPERDGDVITVRFWDLREFNQRLFENHRVAFMKACIVLREVDPTFSKYYPEICERIDRGY